MTKLICPTCTANLKLAGVIPPGKKIKCPRCNTVFTTPEPPPPAPVAVRPKPAPTAAARPKPPAVVAADDEADDYEDRPRKKLSKKKKNQGSGALVYALIGVLAVVLLGGAGVGVWWYLDNQQADQVSKQADFVPGDNETIRAPGRQPAPPDFGGRRGGGAEDGLPGAAPAFDFSKFSLASLSLGDLRVRSPDEFQELFGYLPPDGDVYIGFDVGSLMTNPKIASVVAELEKFVQSVRPDQPDLGLTTKDSDYGLVAFRGDFAQLARGAANYVPSFVSVMRTRQDFDPAKLYAASKGTAAQAQGKTYYKMAAAGGPALVLYAPTSRLLVSGTEDYLDTILGIGPAKPNINDDTMAMIRYVGRSHLWVAASMDQFRDLIPADLDKNPSIPPELKPLLNVVTEAKSVGVAVRLEDRHVQLAATLACADEASAKQAQAALIKFWGKSKLQIAAAGAMIPPEAGGIVTELLSTLTFRAQNDMVGATVRFSFKSLDGVVKAIQNAAQRQTAQPAQPGNFGQPAQPRRPRSQGGPGSGR
jgi:hypothetical protein